MLKPLSLSHGAKGERNLVILHNLKKKQGKRKGRKGMEESYL
jgi:hypothetical protein